MIVQMGGKAMLQRFGTWIVAAFLVMGFSGRASDAAATPSPPTIQFEQPAYEINEDADRGLVKIIVTRTGDLTKQSVVHYATSDGTATAGQDYGPVSGDLTFEPFASIKAFYVTLFLNNQQPLNDHLLEGDETVNIILSNPQGATLGSPSTAVLTIHDDLLRPSPSRISYRYRGSTATISWSDDAANETGYEVERRTNNGDFVRVATLPANTTEFVDRGLREHTTYTYRVRAIRDTGTEVLASAYSLEISFNIGGRVLLPPLQIKISKQRLNFGNVRVGSERRFRITITLVRGTEARVRVGSSGAPFSVVSGGGEFTLTRGVKTSQTVVVAFNPEARRAYRGSLLIGLLSSTRQPGAVRLTGRGR
jgi:hypothetical protein